MDVRLFERTSQSSNCVGITIKIFTITIVTCTFDAVQGQYEKTCNFLKIAVGEVEDFTCPNCSMISILVLHPDFV